MTDPGLNVYKLTALVPEQVAQEGGAALGAMIEDWAKAEGVHIAAVEVIEGEIAGGKVDAPPGWVFLLAQAIGHEQPTADDDTSMDVVVQMPPANVIPACPVCGGGMTINHDRGKPSIFHELDAPYYCPTCMQFRGEACAYCGVPNGQPHRTLVFHPA